MSRIPYIRTTITWKHLLPFALLLTLLLSACGGAGSMSTGSSAGAGTTSAASLPASNTNSANSNSSAGKQQGSSAPIITQYLIKSLKVSMNVKDTTAAADEIQNWISTTDKYSTSAGMDYEQAGDNLYNISLTFSVQATIYPQIERYLRDFAAKHSGHLVGFTESVQDVTNDYVDTNSRLTNLKAEQARILDLLSHAQALGDIITVENKLTDIEGQIENIEAHLKQLGNQTTFYTISISLQPIVLAPPPPQTNTGWNVGQVFHDAFSSSLAFAQGLAVFVIWLLAYSFYLIPAALIVWFIWRRRRMAAQQIGSPLRPSSLPTPPLASAISQREESEDLIQS